jgi:hypothetical protein
MGVTASTLLATAVDHLRADQRAAGRLTKAADGSAAPVDTDSFAKPPEPDCQPQNVAAALPMVTGSAQVHEIPVIGKFWPQGDPDRLRHAADRWNQAADLVDDAQRNAEQHAAPVPVYCSGATITAFQTYVRRIWAADPSGNTVVDSGQPLMENVSAGCRQIARMCQQFADAIDDCRHTLIALGVAAGVITAGGVILTIFTLGGSDAAAAAADASLAAEAAVAAEALAAAEADLAAAAVVAEAESVVAGSLSQLAAVGALTVATTGAVTLAGSGTAQAAPAAFPAIATVPPLPPGPPSGAFSMLSPADQAAARAWQAGLDTRDPNYGTPADRAYQIRVAGQPEVHVFSADGSTAQWADGYRPTDGALIDAKNVRDPACTPRTLQGLQENSLRTQFTIVGDTNEVSDYADAIENPANHAKYLEIDVSDPVSVGYWQYLAAARGVPADVRYIP